MSVALLLIPLALLLLVIAVGAFFWAVDSGQFDDLKDAGAMALEDEPERTAAAAAGKAGEGPGPGNSP